MNAHEAHRVRHLMIRLDRGDELPAALVRALDAAEARSGFITGVGSVEAADLAHYDQAHTAYERPRRIDTPCEVVSLSGNVALLDGAASVRLSAVLARETDVGLATFGGQLVWARAFSLEIHVVAFDDLALTRIADPRTGLPVLASGPTAAPAPRPPAEATRPSLPTDETPKPLEPAKPLIKQTEASVPSPGPALAAIAAIPLPPAPQPPPPAAAVNEGPALPQRPQKPNQDLELYPDVGDVVMHFAFGECTVISSDGDRIRLRQDKDGRVREVALAMLRIEPPALGPDGTRHFKLHRKN